MPSIMTRTRGQAEAIIQQIQRKKPLYTRIALYRICGEWRVKVWTLSAAQAEWDLQDSGVDETAVDIETYVTM